MLQLLWHDWVLLSSTIACTVALWLLSFRYKNDDLDVSELILLRLTFSYWLVYCFASVIQRFVMSMFQLTEWDTLEWDILGLSLKLTAVVSYLLTFACVLTLPFHHLIASRRQVQ